jgi:thioredoxin reductase
LSYELDPAKLGGMDPEFEALVVGGAAAGLSAALVLGRARVRTLVVDAGEPSNRSAPAIGGLLGQDATSPAQLYAAGRAQLGALPSVELRTGVVDTLEAAGGGFRAALDPGGAVAAKRVLLAGGMRYGVPDTPGLAELWGDRAFMCPYCHGWEHRDRRIGILGGAGAAHRVRLLGSWTGDLVVLSDGGPPDEPVDVPVDERPVASVEPGLVRFAGGGELELDALHVVAPMTPRDGLAAGLGLETTDAASGTGFVVADKFGATSVPGVFAAGDAAAGNNVAAAIAGGSLAATGLHRSLVFD